LLASEIDRRGERVRRGETTLDIDRCYVISTNEVDPSAVDGRIRVLHR
jgi:hypothetical protein